MVSNTLPPPEKPSREWKFCYNISHNRWEGYILFKGFSDEEYAWLNHTFGDPSNKTWELSGSWLYFYKDDYMNLFLLRWG